MSKVLHLIVVGKLKDTHLNAIENDYLVRVTNPSLTIHEVKAFAENKMAEAKEVQKKIQEIAKESSPYLILLTEHGKTFNSPDFSKWLYQKIENINQKIIFIIAGAEGHAAELLEIAQEKISLSPLTFPHKLARIIFVEQVYRAQTIFKGHPYHN